MAAEITDLPFVGDNAILLQVDATVMVGIFIFLTIQGWTRTTPFGIQETTDWLIIISILVIPFAISAMLILIDESSLTQSGELTRTARIATFGGFLYIFLVFVKMLYTLFRARWRDRAQTKK